MSLEFYVSPSPIRMVNIKYNVTLDDELINTNCGSENCIPSITQINTLSKRVKISNSNFLLPLSRNTFPQNFEVDHRVTNGGEIEYNSTILTQMMSFVAKRNEALKWSEKIGSTQEKCFKILI